ncbi:MAG TPA: efflux RND transporter periplasmic adaptor subunit [Candidatus Acidoferrales bacterium]|nr:efflux RND transporter periplasmic adaptor subunit [Candidatus Acidoferrales bacterium]
MEKKQLRRLSLAAGVVALLVCVLVWFSRRAPVPGVGVVTVVRQDLTGIVTTNGRVEAIEPAVIRAEMNAFVTQVEVTEGRPVRKGQLLMKLDTSEAEAQLARTRQTLLDAEDALRAARAGGRADEVAQLEADQRKSEAEVERLRKEQASLERLAAQQAATPDEVSLNKLALTLAEATAKQLGTRKEELKRRARLETETSQLQVDRAKTEIESLEKKVRQGNLVAPIEGTLYLLPVHVGDYMHTGELLAEIGSLAHLRIRAFVDEPELGPVAPGQRVLITWDALPNRSWEGRTEQVPKTVVPRNTRSVGEVLCSVDNVSQDLLPNANVSVQIIVHEAKNALVVPRGAVRDEGNHRSVYVVEEGGLGVSTQILRRREIRLGFSSATSFEVLQGLKEGEEVALPGDVDLSDGIKVKAIIQKIPSAS